MPDKQHESANVPPQLPDGSRNRLYFQVRSNADGYSAIVASFHYFGNAEQFAKSESERRGAWPYITIESRDPRLAKVWAKYESGRETYRDA